MTDRQTPHGRLVYHGTGCLSDQCSHFVGLAENCNWYANLDEPHFAIGQAPVRILVNIESDADEWGRAGPIGPAIDHLGEKLVTAERAPVRMLDVHRDHEWAFEARNGGMIYQNWSAVPVCYDQSAASERCIAKVDNGSDVRGGPCVAEDKIGLPTLLTELSEQNGDRNACCSACGPTTQCSNPVSRANGCVFCRTAPVRFEKQKTCPKKEDKAAEESGSCRNYYIAPTHLPHASPRNTSQWFLARAAL